MPTSDSEYLRALTHPSAQKSGSTGVGEKRDNPRYKCEGSAEFRTDGFDVRTWARVTDLSRSGCYVEMQATSPLNTAVSMVIEVGGVRVHAKGTVKTCYPLLGMGIAFTEIPDADMVHLEEILLQLAGGSPPHPEPESSAGTGLLMITDISAALNAVAKFFQTNRTLTREEFAELIGKSQNHNGGRER
jgi:PilZ domain